MWRDIAALWEEYSPKGAARKALVGDLQDVPISRAQDCWEITWQIFVGYATETGCEVRVSKTGGEVTVYSANDPRAEEYGDLRGSAHDKEAVGQVQDARKDRRRGRPNESTGVVAVPHESAISVDRV